METKQHVLDDSAARAAIIAGLGVTQQTLSNWKHRGIPAEHCPNIEALTGARCEELRPDVNWAVLRNSDKAAA